MSLYIFLSLNLNEGHPYILLRVILMNIFVDIYIFCMPVSICKMLHSLT